jgi:uncharacterized protein involved in response to NO
MSNAPRPIWQPFVQLSLAFALSGGFLVGGALFAARSLGVPAGSWWTSAGQAHGHIQLFGWAGLMVFGVGFHFLPRLRGVSLASPHLTRPVLALLAIGLLLRVLIQPALAAGTGGPITGILSIALILSGLFELAGATLAIAILVRTLRQRAVQKKRVDQGPVFAFFLVAFISFWLALVVNAIGLVLASSDATGTLSPGMDSLTVDFALYGFLIPVAVAMSSRTFPLYFQTFPPRNRLLVAGLAVLMIGLGLRLAGDLAGAPWAGGIGRVALAGAIILFCVGLGIFGKRRQLPRKTVQPLSDPLQLHAITAYGWLAIAAVVLMLEGLGMLGLPAPALTPDAERHAIGAGFVTILILGVGAHLLPGFARLPLRSRKLTWGTLLLGNLAALLRVAPVLFAAHGFGTLPEVILAGAGLAGVIAIALFAVNIHGGRTRPEPTARDSSPAKSSPA